MIVIREFRHDRCQHCYHPTQAQHGVVVEYCGVREFYCLDGFHHFLQRLSVMPGVVSVLAEVTQQRVIELPAPQPLKLEQKQ